MYENNEGTATVIKEQTNLLMYLHYHCKAPCCPFQESGLQVYPDNPNLCMKSFNSAVQTVEKPLQTIDLQFVICALKGSD